MSSRGAVRAFAQGNNTNPGRTAVKSEPEIYCPSCDYRPQADDRWLCHPGCGTVWNTFWTSGLCPGCGYQWVHTQCLACGVTSLHVAWYHDRDEDDSSTDEEHVGDRELEEA
jgi:hypothetical protein